MGHNHARLDAAPAPQHSRTIWPARMLPGCPGAADKIRVQYPRQHKLIHPLRGGRRAPPAAHSRLAALVIPLVVRWHRPIAPAALTCEGGRQNRGSQWLPAARRRRRREGGPGNQARALARQQLAGCDFAESVPVLRPRLNVVQQLPQLPGGAASGNEALSLIIRQGHIQRDLREQAADLAAL